MGPVIGKGGFGTVYQGLHVEGGNFVAIKQVRLQGVPKDEINSIMAEIELLRSLNHPKIVQYITYLATARTLSIVMEYVENGSLLRIVKKFGRLPENLAAVYISQVLEGLKFLHEQGVVHRDIKCANILVTKTGDIKIADFGIASKLNDQSGVDVMGTPYWMAPEVIELNGASYASDIWSVGCTVLELLVGQPPYFDLPPMTALYHIVQDDHPPIPDTVSTNCIDWLLCIFKKDPDQRPSAAKLFNHRWLKEARAAQEKSKQSLGIAEGSEQSTASPAAQKHAKRETDDSKSGSKGTVNAQDLMAALKGGIPSLSDSTTRAVMNSDELNLDGLDISELDMGDTLSHFKNPPGHKDNGFGDLSGLTIGDTTEPTQSHTMASMNDDEDLSSLLMELPDSSCYSGGRGTKSSGSQATLTSSFKSSGSSSKPQTVSVENWGDDFLGDVQNLHVKMMTDQSSQSGFSDAFDFDEDEHHSEEEKTTEKKQESTEAEDENDEDEDWDLDLGVSSERPKLRLAGDDTEQGKPIQTGVNAGVNRLTPKKPETSPQPGTSIAHAHQSSSSTQITPQAPVVVVEEDWSNAFSGIGTKTIQLTPHYNTDATTVPDFPMDLPQSQGPLSPTTGAPSTTAPESTGHAATDKRTPGRSPIALVPGAKTFAGWVQHIVSKDNSVMKLSDDEWVVKGKKAGESVQLALCPVKSMDMDVDMDDTLRDDTDDSAGFDDAFWGDDKEEDKETEARRRENISLENALNEAFRVIFEEAPTLPPPKDLEGALKNVSEAIENYPKSIEAAFSKVGFGPIADLLDLLCRQKKTIKSSSSESEDQYFETEDKYHEGLEGYNESFRATLCILQSLFQKSNNLEVMFYRSNGLHTLALYTNAKQPQGNLHMLATVFRMLTPAVLTEFAGCGGLPALGRLLGLLNVGDQSGLLDVLNTLIEVVRLDESTANSDMSRSLVRADVHMAALACASTHLQDTEVANRVGQLLLMLSRRDSTVKRVLCEMATVRAILGLVQTGQEQLRQDLLKTIRDLCMSDQQNVKHLTDAGAIKVLVAAFSKNRNVQMHILAALSRFCKFNDLCMYEAIRAGIVQCLLKAGQNYVLMEDAFSLLMALIRIPAGREELFRWGAVQFFLDHLHDMAYQDRALTALGNWIQKDTQKIKGALNHKEVMHSIARAVETCHNESIIDSLNTLLNSSKTLTQKMAKDKIIFPALLAKLRSPRLKVNTKVNTLRALNRLCKFSRDRASLVAQYNLVDELSAVRSENSKATLIVNLIDKTLSLF